MTIEKTEKTHVNFALICDYCGETVDGAETFEEVRSRAQARGWKILKHREEVLDICTDCQVDGAP